ncbi:MAG: type IV pili methyl-accepting chemotaxis transducer N-terminal domain-containing protein, partial [Caldimonas sp.]
MSSDRQWTLGGKLALVAAPFALLSLGAIAALVWMASQLDGGAAAVNEAGRMRMQTYRMVLAASGGDASALARQIDAFEQSLQLLRRGEPERPLFVPWDDT